MKLKILFTILSLCIFWPGFCQQDIPRFEKITVADISLKECAFEKGASAFYLLNSAKINFNLYSDFSSKIITQRKIRIKILNEKGFEYANVIIPHL